MNENIDRYLVAYSTVRSVVYVYYLLEARFLAKVDKTTPTNEDEEAAADSLTATGQEDQWNEMAPGVDPSAYVPKLLPSNPIPLAPPISGECQPIVHL